jgi:Ca-activated chloride channel family protein
LFRSRYNSGIARYRAGDFAGAAADFRRALETDGSRQDAKRNLELSLRMLSRKSASATSVAPLGRREAGAEPKVLFDFIREKESDRWRSREWKGDSSSAADY